eukprot:TRINITY_DN15041_c0_g1_i1.p1 TRINITY_DN15041_c0_g1~~TRINITY_DN15041_c0_g1_i1.p1  ORF type:complete len:481 (-),score=72.74 TRINITY_DN15041_c0_g1_i1:76-1518(-)
MNKQNADRLQKSVSGIKTRVHDLLHRLASLRFSFQDPSQWPEILGSFSVLVTQYTSLSEELSDVLDEHVIHPLSTKNIEPPQPITELLRTKLEPEIEEEERMLLQLYDKEHGPALNPDIRLGELKSRIGEFNAMCLSLEEVFAKQKEDKLKLSFEPVKMNETLSILLSLDAAISEGKGLKPELQPLQRPIVSASSVQSYTYTTGGSVSISSPSNPTSYPSMPSISSQNQTHIPLNPGVSQASTMGPRPMVGQNPSHVLQPSISGIGNINRHVIPNRPFTPVNSATRGRFPNAPNMLPQQPSQMRISPSSRAGSNQAIPGMVQTPTMSQLQQNVPYNISNIHRVNQPINYPPSTIRSTSQLSSISPTSMHQSVMSHSGGMHPSGMLHGSVSIQQPGMHQGGMQQPGVLHQSAMQQSGSLPTGMMQGSMHQSGMHSQNVLHSAGVQQASVLHQPNLQQTMLQHQSGIQQHSMLHQNPNPSHP